MTESGATGYKPLGQGLGRDGSVGFDRLEMDRMFSELYGEVATIPDPAVGQYVTDGSTPLKYSAYLAEANGDHQLALQNAINHIYSTAGSYNLHLDLEGARITLTEPVVAPVGANFQLRSISNGEVVAGASFVGSHLFKFLGTGRHHLRWHNVTLIGSNVAGWIEWDDGDFMFSFCAFRNNVNSGGVDANAGLKATGEAHYHIRNNCHFTVSEGSVEPNLRDKVAIYGDKGDNKIESAILSYFKHAVVNDAITLMVNDVHIFQGVSGQENTASHTAGIKLQAGMCGSELGSIYLDKCFVEINNKANPNAASIGGVTIQQLKTLLTSAEANFAYIVARDYHAKTGLTVKNVVITESEFTNYGTALAYPTRLYDAASFGPNSFDQIHMRDNTFISNIQPQANPVTVAHEQGSANLSKSVSMANLFPFSARPSYVLSVAARPSSGTPGGLYVGNINRTGQSVAVNSATSYAGTTLVTATANLAAGGASGGFVAT